MIDLKDSLMTDILPGHLATAEVKALAYAIGRQVKQLCAYADKSRTYAALASAPDTVLDALAAELRTPAYDETLPVETKRELVASTLTFYTHLGTGRARAADKHPVRKRPRRRMVRLQWQRISLQGSDRYCRRCR